MTHEVDETDVEAQNGFDCESVRQQELQRVTGCGDDEARN